MPTREIRLVSGTNPPIFHDSAQEIVVFGPESGAPAIIQASGSKPALQANNSERVSLQPRAGIEIVGNGAQGIRALRILDCDFFDSVGNVKVRGAQFDQVQIASTPNVLIDGMLCDAAGSGFSRNSQGTKIWAHGLYVAGDNRNLESVTLNNVICKNAPGSGLQINGDGRRVRNASLKQCRVYDCCKEGGAAFNLLFCDLYTLVSCLGVQDVAWDGGAVNADSGRGNVDSSTFFAQQGLHGPIALSNSLLGVGSGRALDGGASADSKSIVGPYADVNDHVNADYSSKIAGIGWSPAGAPPVEPPVEPPPDGDLEAENEALKAENEALKAENEALKSQYMLINTWYSQYPG